MNRQWNEFAWHTAKAEPGPKPKARRYTIASFRRDVERELGWELHESWHKEYVDSHYKYGGRNAKAAARRIQLAEDDRKRYLVPR